ncbi:MAG: hypothetical protein M3313_09860, partial [Actinomycetota bacterium]|nr:hypothetical protein [Actinomycetota bacterium]
MNKWVTFGRAARSVRPREASRTRRIRPIAVLALIVAVLSLAAPAALADAPGPAVLLSWQAQAVSTGAGNQTDPHLSGSLLVFTALDQSESRIRYVDLAGGAGGDIPNVGARDSLPDVSGDLIVFRRVFTDGSTFDRPIMVFDVAAPELGARELAPQEGARRAMSSIGGTTVAFMQFVESSSSQSE